MALRHGRPSCQLPMLDLLGGDLAAAQARYIDLFDLSRKHTLYLTYWTDGDTRRRGEPLAAIRQRYRRTNYLVDTGDICRTSTGLLPMILEYAALADAATAPRCYRNTAGA